MPGRRPQRVRVRPGGRAGRDRDAAPTDVLNNMSHRTGRGDDRAVARAAAARPCAAPDRDRRAAREPSLPRYVIIGAGAIGVTLAAELHRSGHPVALVARGAQLEAARADGITYARPHGLSLVEATVYGGPDELQLTGDDAAGARDQDPGRGRRAGAVVRAAGVTSRR